MIDLRNLYPKQFNILNRLFNGISNKQITRLNKIFEVSERRWSENLHWFIQTKVKYLLIAEAPPWSNENETVRYFYNSFNSKFHREIWYTFYPKLEFPSNKEEGLKLLAKKQFLLIDTLPFAMSYSNPNRRKNKLYFQLVCSCVPFLFEKINNPRICWNDNVKVAFPFELHGKTIIKSLCGKLVLPYEQIIQLSEKLISTNKAHYTDKKMLRGIYDLK